jgi:hypothetical protein
MTICRNFTDQDMKTMYDLGYLWTEWKPNSKIIKNMRYGGGILLKAPSLKELLESVKDRINQNDNYGLFHGELFLHREDDVYSAELHKYYLYC